MKYPLLSLAAGLLALSAGAETLQVKPVMDETARQCADAPGIRDTASPTALCACVVGNMTDWVNASDGLERQKRLWMFQKDNLRKTVPQDEIYSRAAEAGISRPALVAAEAKYYDTVERHFLACAELMQPADG